MSVERYTTTRLPYARAVGAPSVVAGTYDGAELKRLSCRPGAYDALALPSRMGAHLVPPPAHIPSHQGSTTRLEPQEYADDLD